MAQGPSSPSDRPGGEPPVSGAVRDDHEPGAKGEVPSGSRWRSWRRSRHWATGGIGLGAGLLNGLLGIGGGILIVPGLMFLRNLAPRTAVATSLGTVLLLSGGTLAVHVAISGYRVSWLGSVLVFIAGGLAAQVGGWLLKRMSPRASLLAFAFIAGTASLNLISQGLGLYALGGEAAQAPPLWSYPAVGIVTGISSGLLGIGGGGLVTLFFAAAFNVPILDILPLALAVNVVNAGSGVLGQWRERQVRWKEVMGLTPAAVVGIALGVKLALVVPPQGLKVVFGLFFLYLGVRMLKKGLASGRPKSSSDSQQ